MGWMNHQWHTSSSAVLGLCTSWTLPNTPSSHSLGLQVICIVPNYSLLLPSLLGSWKVIPQFLQTVSPIAGGNMVLSHCCTCSLGDGWCSFHGLDWVALAACKRKNHQPPLHTGIVIIILEKVPEIQLSNLFPLCSLSLDLMTFNISTTISCWTEQESSIMLSKHDGNRTHLFISVH